MNMQFNTWTLCHMTLPWTPTENQIKDTNEYNKWKILWSKRPENNHSQTDQRQLNKHHQQHAFYLNQKCMPKND